MDILEKSPYILVLGDKEMEEKTVAVRKRGGKDTITMNFEDFLNEILSNIKNKAL